MKKPLVPRWLIALLVAGLQMETVLAACGASFCTITTTPEAFSEPTGQVRFDLSYEYIDQDSPYSGSDESDGVQFAVFPDGDAEAVHRELETVSQRISLRTSVGIIDRLTLDLLVPFIDREHDHFEFEDDEQLPGEFDFSGLGDVTLVGRYALLAPINPNLPTLAIGAGVKLPAAVLGTPSLVSTTSSGWGPSQALLTLPSGCPRRTRDMNSAMRYWPISAAACPC